MPTSLTNREASAVIEAALAAARGAIGLDLAYVAEFEAGAQVTRHLDGDAGSFGQSEGLAIPLAETYCDRMARGQLPNAIPDTSADDRVRALPVTDAAGIGCYIGVPIVLPDGRTYGSLCCLGHEPAALDDRDVRFMRALAVMVSDALARRAQEKEERRRELERQAVARARVLDRAEGELRRNRKELQAVIDNGPSVIFVKDVEGRYLLLNRRFEELFSVRQADALGRTDADLFPADVARTVRANDRAVLRHGAALTDEEVVPVDGKDRTFIATKFPLLDQQGAPYAVCGIATDISDRKRMEDTLLRRTAQLAEAQRVGQIGSWEYDAAAGTLETSEELRRLHGLPAAPAPSLAAWSRLIDQEDLARLSAALATPGAPRVLSYRATVPDAGGERIFEVHAEWTRDATRLVGTTQDITERRRSEAALRESEHRMRLILDSAQEAFVGMDEAGRVTDWNAQAEVMFGWSAAEAAGRRVGDLIVPERLRPAHETGLLRARETGASAVQGRRLELPAMHRDGHEVPIEMTISAVRGPRGLIFHAFLRDISERKQAEEKLTRQALYDQLTGLPNRALMLDRLGRAVDRARARQRRCAVLFIDIDNFKLVNDSLGHDRGDELLLRVAERIERTVRAEDTVARFGGDEFVVLCGGLAGERDAVAQAERIGTALLEPMMIGSSELTVTASVGIALSVGGSERPDDLLRDADAAMYRAKQRGRARHEVFDHGMRTDAIERLRLENDLRRALQREELRVVYQPIVALADGSAVAVEALVRWEHPERGMVPPSAFIPIAEESRLIHRIGEWVLRRACQDAATWHGAGFPDVTVSVNLSPRQLADPRLSQTVRNALHDTGVPPGRLTLELTETALMERDDPPATVLDDLKAIGVRLSLDDFGTGYSSLSYLRDLPIDVLKLDRSFIAGITEDPTAAAIVASIANMAAALGLPIVAEGIEDAAQLRALQELGCRLGQGFHFSRPVPVDALMRWLTGEPAAAPAPGTATPR